MGLRSKSLGIITFYSKQRSLISRKLEDLGCVTDSSKPNSISVRTVDGFQVGDVVAFEMEEIDGFVGRLNIIMPTRSGLQLPLCNLLVPFLLSIVPRAFSPLVYFSYTCTVVVLHLQMHIDQSNTN